jgi:PAS domain S-box-containing protein
LKSNQTTDVPSQSADASVVSRHALAVLSVGLSFLLALGMGRYGHILPPFSLFLFAIIFSGWFGGYGPVLLAITLSALVFDYYFLPLTSPETHSLVPKWNDLPRLILFAIAALMVGLLSAAQRGAAQLIRRARDDLAAKVQELRRINNSLNAENAERRLAEIALEGACAAIKQSEVRFRTTLDSIPVQVWCAFPDGSAEFQSKPWLEYTGLSAEQAHGWGWQDAIHPDDAEPYVKKWLEIKESRAPGEAEARFRRFDGQYRWFLMRAGPLHDEQGHIIRWYGTSMDIDDRKRAQHALHNAEAALAHITRITTMGELTASIAHEINQPLGAVINNANACISLLTNGAANLEEVRDALTEIIEGADRASAVIARIRQLSRKVPGERILLDLRDVVTDILTLARYEAAARRVNIHIDLPEEQLPPVMGDRVQLQQVLLNLVVNGMDAMNTIEESKRVVRIRGSSEARDGIAETSVSVRDAGTGLKPGEMDRLFEAFYTTKPQGMGMGLAISRSIIEAHGGRLWAEVNPGPGATFVFSLPAAPTAAS